MKKIIIKCAICLLAVFFFSNCASIVSRSVYPLSINSTPSGANVVVTSSRGVEVFSGTTPAVVHLRAGNGFFSRAEYHVRVSLQGFETRVIPVTFSIDGWYFGNLLLFGVGGFIGMLIIDPATGAMWRIDMDAINVNFIPQSTVYYVPSLRIMDINEIPESWKSKLIALDE